MYRQAEKIITYCDGCGGEIYAGDMVYVISRYGVILHADADCLIQYLEPEYMTAEEAIDAIREG